MVDASATHTLDHHWRASLALARTSLAAAVLAVPQSLVLKLLPDASPRLPRLFHRAMCKAAGVSVDIYGRPVREQGVLFVVNHISWLDIPVIGSVILGSFVAKAEVSEMGLVGRMSDLQRTIYVERDRRSATHTQRNEIVQRLAEGHNVILFPEGTSGVGAHVLPFKTALFSVADDPEIDVLIQPVTLAYTHINGLPINRSNRYKIAWVGDMEFGSHAWDLLGLGKIGASLQFHPAVHRSDFANRKALARHCEIVVGDGLRQARGRSGSSQEAAHRL
jgi:lyso-ornithine lipid O-acyltransferase